MRGRRGRICTPAPGTARVAQASVPELVRLVQVLLGDLDAGDPVAHEREVRRGGRVVAAAPALGRETVYPDRVAAVVDEQLLRFGAHLPVGLLVHPANDVEHGVHALVLAGERVTPRDVHDAVPGEQLLQGVDVAGRPRLHTPAHRLDVWMLGHENPTFRPWCPLTSSTLPRTVPDVHHPSVP